MGTGFNGDTPVDGLKYEYYMSQGLNSDTGNGGIASLQRHSGNRLIGTFRLDCSAAAESHHHSEPPEMPA